MKLESDERKVSITTKDEIRVKRTLIELFDVGEYLLQLNQLEQSVSILGEQRVEAKKTIDILSGRDNQIKKRAEEIQAKNRKKVKQEVKDATRTS